jgi:flagellar protein FliO/FliZ
MTKLLLSFFYILSNPVIAAQTSETAQTLQSSPISAGNLIQTILALILVLFCIFLVAWLLKNSQRFHGAANGQLKVIASLSLGPRERLAVVQVGQQQLLLGITAQNIQALHELSEPLQMDVSESNKPEFAQKLKDILQQKEDKQ